MALSAVYLGLGSNLGDRLEMLRQACLRLGGRSGIELDGDGGIASVYETSAVGDVEQPDYLNTAIRISTRLSPEALLEACLAVEQESGRKRRRRGEARVIDVDILLFGEQVLSGERLTVPHPRMHERRFVLEPLSEIAPDFIHPVLGRRIASLAAELRSEAGGQEVQRVAGPEWAAGRAGDGR